MNADNITVIFSDASGDQWCDLTINLHPAANQFDDLSTDITDLETEITTIQNYVDSLETRLTEARADLLDNLANLDTAVSTRSSHDDPDPSGYIDAPISSRSSHDDPDPNGYIDAAISGVSTGGVSAADIADAVWDEATADHQTAGSTGAALLNSTGAAAGAIEVTDILINDGTNPIEGAEVWITTDAAGTNTIWAGTTNALGYPKDVNDENPFLDAGTYYLWVQKGSYSFSNPTSKTVS